MHLNMENLYEILGCDALASHEEIKKAFQTLALKHHPDKSKVENTNSQSTSEQFIKINLAWKILSDPISRKQFDLRWAERCLVQSHPVQDTIDFEEFELRDFESCNRDSDTCVPVEDETKEEYHYICRCGGSYVLTIDDVRMKFDIVCCDSCSLTIKVLYSDDEGVS